MVIEQIETWDLIYALCRASGRSIKHSTLCANTCTEESRNEPDDCAIAEKFKKLIELTTKGNSKAELSRN